MANNADQIKRIAKGVYRVLGSGFAENVYDRAMQVGLRLAKITYEGQKVVELRHKNHCVGEGYPDLVVRLGREKMIVELKAVGGQMGAAEEQQLRNYMKLLGINRGLLINFQQPGKTQKKTRLEIKRFELRWVARLKDGSVKRQDAQLSLFRIQKGLVMNLCFHPSNCRIF